MALFLVRFSPIELPVTDRSFSTESVPLVLCCVDVFPRVVRFSRPPRKYRPAPAAVILRVGHFHDHLHRPWRHLGRYLHAELMVLIDVPGQFNRFHRPTSNQSNSVFSPFVSAFLPAAGALPSSCSQSTNWIG